LHGNEYSLLPLRILIACYLISMRSSFIMNVFHNVSVPYTYYYELELKLTLLFCVYVLVWVQIPQLVCLGEASL
jgi:hypothetical protein